MPLSDRTAGVVGVLGLDSVQKMILMAVGVDYTESGDSLGCVMRSLENYPEGYRYLDLQRCLGVGVGSVYTLCSGYTAWSCSPHIAPIAVAGIDAEYTTILKRRSSRKVEEIYTCLPVI